MAKYLSDSNLSSLVSLIKNSLNLKINTSEMGEADGVATLGSDGKLSSDQVPATKTINGQTILGDGDIELDLSAYVCSTTIPTLSNNADTSKIYIVLTNESSNASIYAFIDSSWTLINTVSLTNLEFNLNNGYIYKGIAATNTNPDILSGNVFYFARTAGTYTNFDNIEIERGGLYILSYNGTAWSITDNLLMLSDNDVTEYLISSLWYPSVNLINKNNYITGHFDSTGTFQTTNTSFVVTFVPFLKDLSIYRFSDTTVYGVGFDSSGNIVTITTMDVDTFPHVDGAVIAGLTYTYDNLSSAYARYTDEADNNNENEGFQERAEAIVDEIDIAATKDVVSLAFTKSKNLFNKSSSAILKGYYLSNTGTRVANDNYFISHYISFDENTGTIFISQNGTTFTPGTSLTGGGYITLYDSELNSVRSYSTSDASTGISWEEGVMFLRFSATQSVIDSIQVEVGNAITEYEEYSSFTPNFSIDAVIEDYSISESKLDIFNRTFFNPDDEDIAYGYYLLNNGNLSGNTGYNVTGYVPFTSSLKKLTMIYLSGTVPAGGAFICGFDSDKNFAISYGTLSENSGVVEWQTGIAYVRFSYASAQTPYIYAGDEAPTTYCDYGNPKIKDEYLPDITTTTTTENFNQITSLLGSDGETISSDTLSSGNSLTLSDFPYYTKKGVSLSFFTKLTSFDTLLIGRGYQAYGGAWLEITNSEVTAYEYNTSAISRYNGIHDLTIEEYIKVILSWDDAGYVFFIIQTKTGYFKGSTNISSSPGYPGMGAPFVTSNNSELTDVKFSATCRDFRCPVWMFGDSYFGIGNASRWPTYLRDWGFINFYIAGLSGGTAANLYPDLQRALTFGTPKYILWCLGMNGEEDSSISYIESLKTLCEDNNITLILATIPTVPDRDRETLREYVESSGYRYVDFYKAVGTNSSGEWYEGYLGSDNLHPDSLGAQALATQVLVDFPEIMQYGFSKTISVSTELSE